MAEERRNISGPLAALVLNICPDNIILVHEKQIFKMLKAINVPTDT